MAPAVEMAAALAKRYIRCDTDIYGNQYCDSNWDLYGRWVVFAILILLGILFLILLSVSRRRRRRGLQPYYGTGWMAAGAKPFGQQPGPAPYGYNNQQPYQPPPPPYGPQGQQPQYTGQTFNRNDGYYGQESGIELQQPSTAYQRGTGGEAVYEPPSGPPPGKH